MRLELSTESLNVQFSCTDKYADDLAILDAIRDLVSKLEHHEGVTLSIESREEEPEESTEEPEENN